MRVGHSKVAGTTAAVFCVESASPLLFQQSSLKNRIHEQSLPCQFHEFISFVRRQLCKLRNSGQERGEEETERYQHFLSSFVNGRRMDATSYWNYTWQTGQSVNLPPFLPRTRNFKQWPPCPVSARCQYKIWAKIHRHIERNLYPTLIVNLNYALDLTSTSNKI